MAPDPKRAALDMNAGFAHAGNVSALCFSTSTTAASLLLTIVENVTVDEGAAISFCSGWMSPVAWDFTNSHARRVCTLDELTLIDAFVPATVSWTVFSALRRSTLG